MLGNFIIYVNYISQVKQWYSDIIKLCRVKIPFSNEFREWQKIKKKSLE